LFGAITLKVLHPVHGAADEYAVLLRGSKAARATPGGRAGGTGERVARKPLTGRVAAGPTAPLRSGPVGERATPTPGQDPLGRWMASASLRD